MYNFVNNKLCLKVSTDVAAMDNYEPDNLISDNFLIRSRGFIAYSSIKPPVHVNFELICPINIHYVLVSTCLGSQKTTGIEVIVKDSSANVSIANAVFDEPGVVFCNSRKYSKKPPPITENDFCVRYFKANTFRSFTSAKTVTIKITRTEKSLPCLAKVEIWGEVARSCSEVTRNTIDQIMNRCNGEPVIKNVQSPAQEYTKDFEIPDDFKDELTFECMAIPMTLPSGHTIDQSTLEKHAENEALFGRHANDPFTGLVFTENRRPVLNVALKNRIDMFLVQYSHRRETFGVKRTLGGSSSSCNKKLKLSDEERKCSSCDDKCDLYCLPCKHLYCKKCLIKTISESEERKCCKCDKSFLRNEPYRVHL